MKRILFVAQHRPNRNPSQRYRFEQYLDFLQAEGYSYDFSFLLDEKDDAAFYKSGNYLRKLIILIKSVFRRFRDLRRAAQYDAVFVQREAIMLGSSFFERQFSKKSKLIYDFDDAIWLPHVSEGNRPLSWLKRPEKTAEIIEASSRVLAGNAYLASYARSFNEDVHIFPTTIDMEAYQPQAYPGKPTDKVCIGWTGSSTTLFEFVTFEKVLRQLADKYGDQIYIKLIGQAEYTSDLIEVKSVAWSSETEVLELSELDIGIMPLHTSDWSRGKCACKGLQYMALGIPAVMSAIGVNREIIHSGENGFLCETEEEWIAALSALIESAALRKKLGENGQKTVREKYARQRWQKEFLRLMQIAS